MARKSSASKGPKKTIKISGSTYRHKQCSRKKTDAKKAADNQRKKGRTARVVKNGNQYCVYVGPMRKKSRKKR